MLEILADSLSVAARADRLRQPRTPLANRRGWQKDLRSTGIKEEMMMMHVRNEDFAPTPALVTPAAGPLGRTGRAIMAWLRRLERAQVNHRAAETLASMDEHLLRDIGVTRVQAKRLALGLED